MNGHNPVGALYYILLTTTLFFIAFNAFNLTFGLATPWLAWTSLLLNIVNFAVLRWFRGGWEKAFERRMQRKELENA
jgi:hypothetical protein